MFPVIKIPKLLIFIRFFNNEESEFPGFSFFYRKITGVEKAINGSSVASWGCVQASVVQWRGVLIPPWKLWSDHKLLRQSNRHS